MGGTNPPNLDFPERWSFSLRSPGVLKCFKTMLTRCAVTYAPCVHVHQWFFFSGLYGGIFLMKLYPHGHMVNIQKMNLGNFIEKRSLGAFFYCPRSRFFFNSTGGSKPWKENSNCFRALNIWGWVKTYYFYCIKKGINIPLPIIYGFTRVWGFDSYPYLYPLAI